MFMLFNLFTPFVGFLDDNNSHIPRLIIAKYVLYSGFAVLASMTDIVYSLLGICIITLVPITDKYTGFYPGQ